MQNLFKEFEGGITSKGQEDRRIQDTVSMRSGRNQTRDYDSGPNLDLVDSGLGSQKYIEYF